MVREGVRVGQASVCTEAGSDKTN